MKLVQKTSLPQTCGVEDFPAKTYRLQTKENERGLKDQEVDCSINSQNLQERQNLIGYLLKMFRGYLIQKEEVTSNTSSIRWMNSGMVFRGECWTQNTLEHHKDVEESILSEVLEHFVPLKYFLNTVQLKSLLNRADMRSIPMPQGLRETIESQITTLSNMPELEEFLQQGHKQKDTEMMEKHIHATPEEALMLYVRRMLPLEYERLQGFPVNWTQVDGDL